MRFYRLGLRVHCEGPQVGTLRHARARPRTRACREPELGRALRARLERAVVAAGRPVTLMHVCGSHEQAMARYGLRSTFPSSLRVQMGPGCPVCVTDAPEIDACEALAPTTAVTTAALLLGEPPPNLFVLSAHKWVPAAMEVVASTPGTHIEGYLAAGHAATITGYGVFESFVAKHRVPVVVGGFEPLDILSALALLVEQVVRGKADVVNAFPRCVSRDGNRRALDALYSVFAHGDGDWRGIAHVPSGDLQLRPEFAAWDATRRFAAELAATPEVAERANAKDCRCGAIMSGMAVAPLNGLVRVALTAGGTSVHAMKDPTRGGVTGALAEMSEKAGLGVLLDAASIPMSDAARAAAELLGIDPLFVANEGKAIIGVRADSVARVLDALRAHPLGTRAACIGRVVDGPRGAVLLDTGFGTRRLYERDNDPLPRIC